MKKRFLVLLINGCVIAAALAFGAALTLKRGGRSAQPEAIDVRGYETRFFQAVRLLSANTMAVSDLANSVSRNWIKAIALGLDSTQQIERVFAQLQESGAQAKLSGDHEELKTRMQALKDFPFSFRTAFGVLEETYAVYTELFKLSLHPSGSLVIFNKQVQELEGELAKNFNRLTLYTPKVSAEPPGAVPDRPVIMAKQEISSVEQPGSFEGKTEAEVEKILGRPVNEVYASATNFAYKQYRYKGKDYTVYYKSDVVSGWTD